MRPPLSGRGVARGHVEHAARPGGGEDRLQPERVEQLLHGVDELVGGDLGPLVELLAGPEGRDAGDVGREARDDENEAEAEDQRRDEDDEHSHGGNLSAGRRAQARRWRS